MQISIILFKLPNDALLNTDHTSHQHKQFELLMVENLIRINAITI